MPLQARRGCVKVGGMRIGLARRGYSPTGGAENYLSRLGAALHDKGHEPVLFASTKWPHDRWSATAGCEIVRGTSPKAFADGLLAAKVRERVDLLFSLERVWNCDCYRAGDGVHRAWLERRAKFEPAWRGAVRRFNPKHRQLLELEDATFSRDGARVIIANSHLVRREILDRFPDCAPARVKVVYNGLPTEYFKPFDENARRQARADLGLEPSDCVVLFAGSGWERKGLQCAVDAFAMLGNLAGLRLLVAGKGDPKKYQQQISSERVRFVGSGREMASIYAAADLFVLPTIYDPFSNACLEALAAGLPVLTTTANGFSEVIAPGEIGEVFAPGDATVLAGHLRTWADPERRQAARTVCTAAAAPFTIERNVAETLNILSHLASKASGPH